MSRRQGLEMTPSYLLQLMEQLLKYAETKLGWELAAHAVVVGFFDSLAVLIFCSYWVGYLLVL